MKKPTLVQQICSRIKVRIERCDHLERLQSGLADRLNNFATPYSEYDSIVDDARRISSEKVAVLEEIKFLRSMLD